MWNKKKRVERNEMEWYEITHIETEINAKHKQQWHTDPLAFV